MNEKKNIYEILEEEIMEADVSEEERELQLEKLSEAREQEINIMIVGATGSGKSSTINSIFNTRMAKVGIGADPETKGIECYRLENMTIWDTPGIGDGIENDAEHARLISEKLTEVDDDGVPVIDLVMVVIDGSTKDLSSTYEMINNIIIPCISEEDAHRILIAVNQADIAMKGQHWDKENNCPDEILDGYLKDKCESIRRRILETTGYDIQPVYYCAGYTDENEVQNKPYNLTKLLYHIVTSLPAEKRIAIADNLNKDGDMWECDDEEEDYKDALSHSFGQTFLDATGEYAEKGFTAGGVILGMPGAVIGGIIGGAAGAVIGIFKGLFSL